MTPLIKSLVGIGLAGGVTGLSVGGYYLLKPSEPKTLEEKFNREGIKVLDYEATADSTDGGWNDKLTKYQATENTNVLPNLQKEGVDLTKLKKACKDHLKKSPEEVKKTQDLEAKIRVWCAKDKLPE